MTLLFETLFGLVLIHGLWFGLSWPAAIVLLGILCFKGWQHYEDSRLKAEIRSKDFNALQAISDGQFHRLQVICNELSRTISFVDERTVGLADLQALANRIASDVGALDDRTGAIERSYANVLRVTEETQKMISSSNIGLAFRPRSIRTDKGPGV